MNDIIVSLDMNKYNALKNLSDAHKKLVHDIVSCFDEKSFEESAKTKVRFKTEEFLPVLKQLLPNRMKSCEIIF